MTGILTDNAELMARVEALQMANKTLQEINTRLVEHNSTLIASAQAHEARMASVLAELAKLRSEHHDLLIRHAQAHRQLAAYRTTPLVRQPVCEDEYGPVYKDELDADALRDGRLVRSEASRQRKFSKAPPPLEPDDRELEAIIAARRKALDGRIQRDTRPMDVNNIVGGPNETALAAERRKWQEEQERRVAQAINAGFESNKPAYGDKVLGDPRVLTAALRAGLDESINQDEPPYNGRVNRELPTLTDPINDDRDFRKAPSDVTFPELSAPNVVNQSFQSDETADLHLDDLTGMDGSRPGGSDETTNTPEKSTEQR